MAVARVELSYRSNPVRWLGEWHIVFFAILLAFTIDPASAQQAGLAAFEDATSRLGALQAQRTWGATWADINNDGWPDLFLTNHHIRAPYVLRNEFGESFTNISAGSNLSRRTDQHSCKWSDFDQDADWDVFCSTGANEGTALVPMRFLRNRGNGEFDDIAQQSGTSFPDGRGRGVCWFDADGDADLDLFVGTEVTDITHPLSRIFRNNGASFQEFTAE